MNAQVAPQLARARRVLYLGKLQVGNNKLQKTDPEIWANWDWGHEHAQKRKSRRVILDQKYAMDDGEENLTYVAKWVKPCYDRTRDWDLRVERAIKESKAVMGHCIDGAGTAHAQNMHMGRNPKCQVCCESDIKQKQRRSQMNVIRMGTMAVDLVQLSQSGERCMTAVMNDQEGGRGICATPVSSKGSHELCGAVAKGALCMVQEQVRGAGMIRRSHCGRGSGIVHFVQSD